MLLAILTGKIIQGPALPCTNIDVLQRGPTGSFKSSSISYAMRPFGIAYVLPTRTRCNFGLISTPCRRVSARRPFIQRRVSVNKQVLCHACCLRIYYCWYEEPHSVNVLVEAKRVPDKR